jgi:hypothetical protein
VLGNVGWRWIACKCVEIGNEIKALVFIL